MGEMCWVYVLSPQGPYPALFTVGFYRPDGTWEPESDYPTREEASARVNYLNGQKP